MVGSFAKSLLRIVWCCAMAGVETLSKLSDNMASEDKNFMAVAGDIGT